MAAEWTGWVQSGAGGLLGWDTSISPVILPGTQGHPGFLEPPTFLLLGIHHLLQGPM